MTSSDPTGLPYVLLLTRDDAGIMGFPGILISGELVLLQEFPYDRLDGICPGEILIVTAADGGMRVRRVRPTGTRAVRNGPDGPTVTALVHLSHNVAVVSLPKVTSDEPSFEALLESHQGNVAVAIQAAGTRTILRGQDGEQDGPEALSVVCTPPEVKTEIGAWSICKWLDWC